MEKSRERLLQRFLSAKGYHCFTTHNGAGYCYPSTWEESKNLSVEIISVAEAVKMGYVSGELITWADHQWDIPKQIF